MSEEQPKPKPGGLLEEQAAAIAGGPVGTAIAAAHSIMSASETTGSAGQYMIGPGGGGGADRALSNAMLGALNKIATLKSRM